MGSRDQFKIIDLQHIQKQLLQISCITTVPEPPEYLLQSDHAECFMKGAIDVEVR
jgi:hypothetical protein